MSFNEVIAALPRLTFEERQILISRALELDDPPLSPADEELVEERLAAHHSDPDSSVPLDEMKRRLQALTFNEPGLRVQSQRMNNHVIHVSEAEAKDDFASLLDRVLAGAEVVIENGSSPVAVLRPATACRGRTLSASIALAEEHAKELGYTPTLDPDFAADLAEIINSHREPLNPPAWD